MSEFSMETFIRVYDDSTGNYIQIGPDANSLGLVELREFEGGKERARLTMPARKASLVADAICNVISALAKEGSA